MKHSLATAISLILAAGSAQAQDSGGSAQPMESIIVYGEDIYRDRSDTINPTLNYNLQFFQRFEPTTVGEMLKRTPSVSFTADVLEYDAVQMRGLASQYTQILVNGRAVPGQSANGTFLVDRIPSELVERIELVRSPSIDVTGEGVAGALNVVLKNGEDLQGSFVRVGGSYYPDDKPRNAESSARSAAFATASSSLDHNFWVGVNMQERKNPKTKYTTIYAIEDDEYESEDEDDVRSGTDYSLNTGAWIRLGEGEMSLNGFYVETDRTEREIVDIFEGLIGNRIYDETETQLEEIDQKSYGIDAVITQPVEGGSFDVSFAVNGFEEYSVTFEDDELDGVIDIDDLVYNAGIAYSFLDGDQATNKTGVDIRLGQRDGTQIDGLADLDELYADIDSTRVALFTKFSFHAGDNLSIEVGGRYENYDREISFDDEIYSNSGNELLPAVHAIFDVSSDARIRASLARTIRYPDYDLITPFEEAEEPNDDDTLRGNPNLELETALGLDLGYERQFGARGLFGVNLFYRDVSDLIEITELADEPDVYTPINVGDGEAWGVEFDMSTPLDFWGMDNTSFYANVAFLDSEVTDPHFGIKRKFTNQPDFVYNVSLTHNFMSRDMAVGFSYQGRDSSDEYAYDEIVTTDYDGNLELFFEKRFSQKLVMRVTGTNLLDAVKREDIIKYDGDSLAELRDAIAMDQRDELEVQLEESSPMISFTLRAAF